MFVINQPTSTPVFVTLLTLSLTYRSTHSQDIIRREYHLEEECVVGTLVGNAGRDSGLYNKFRREAHLLLFQPFSHGNEHISYFSVNSSSGIIRTAKNIDREELCPGLSSCVVKLNIAVYKKHAASDSSSLVHILEIAITIYDINDNSPTFPNRVVNLSVPENQARNYQVETSVASDPDEDGVNSRITYRLEPPSDIFELSTVKTTDGVEDLVITLKTILDREEKTSYTFLVLATDLGDPPRSGSVQVVINVIDVNDHAPVFGRLDYSVKVLENSDVSVPVVIVSAVDRDEGENARVTYAFGFQVSPEIRDTFAIEPVTGKIFSKRPLDYEKNQLYQFSVVATDHGNPARSNYAFVNVHVIDVNDNVPIIQVNLAPGGDTVVENGSVGKFLAYIKITDSDSGQYGQISCDIEDDHFLLEQVATASGSMYKIKLRTALDREETFIREVVVTCRDGDLNPYSASASFPLTIEDVNDNAPIFLAHSLQGSVPENGNDVMYVTQVIAADPDEGENSRVAYKISSGNEKFLFNIDERTGVVSTSRTLDREIQSHYYLEVTATDHGYYPMTSSATVTINVLDDNDNPPRFRQHVFSRSIRENLPAGSPVGIVLAHDPDIDDNARVKFSILDDKSDSSDSIFFRIDPMSGFLTSAISFDRENKSIYKFRVQVSDPTTIAFYDIANVTVTIDDDNDHAPYIVRPPPTNRTFRLPFNTSTGDLITSVLAQDEDDPHLSDITYHLRSATGHSLKKWPLFSLDRNSGKLRLSRPIRPDDVTTHTLEITVTDGSGPNSKSATITLSVVVEEGSPEQMRSFMDSGETNVIIIIIIVAATLFVTFVIAAIIYLIKQVDKKRQTQLPAKMADGSSKLYEAAKWVSSASVGKESPTEEAMCMLELSGDKRRKKEVTFSLGGHIVTAEAQRPPEVKVVTKATRVEALHFNLGNHKSDVEEFIVMDGMTTPDYSQHLYGPASLVNTHPHEPQFMEVHPSADDRFSDASSGDTGTSDSGRGGSEDEGHGHVHPHPVGDEANDRKKPNRRKRPDTDVKMHVSPPLPQIPDHPLPADAEDVPGSPTPLLSQKDRQVHSPRFFTSRTFQDSYSSPSRSSSGPTPEALQNPYREEISRQSNSPQPYGTVPEDEPLPLRTFFSPYTAADSSLRQFRPGWNSGNPVGSNRPVHSQNTYPPRQEAHDNPKTIPVKIHQSQSNDSMV